MVLEGPVTVTGQVNGSVIAADGVVRLAESARVGGDVLASETILIRPGAKVARGDAGRGPVLLRGAPRRAREAPRARRGLGLRAAHRPRRSCCSRPAARTPSRRRSADAPLASLGWGILVAISVPITAVALVVSVLGLPAGPRAVPVPRPVVAGRAHVGGVVRRPRAGPGPARPRAPRSSPDGRSSRPSDWCRS